MGERLRGCWQASCWTCRRRRAAPPRKRPSWMTSSSWPASRPAAPALSACSRQPEGGRGIACPVLALVGQRCLSPWSCIEPAVGASTRCTTLAGAAQPCLHPRQVPPRFHRWLHNRLCRGQGECRWPASWNVCRGTAAASTNRGAVPLLLVPCPCLAGFQDPPAPCPAGHPGAAASYMTASIWAASGPAVRAAGCQSDAAMKELLRWAADLGQPTKLLTGKL